MNIEFPNDFFLQIFDSQPSETHVALEHAIVDLVGDASVVGSSFVNVESYAKQGLCKRELQPSPRPISTTHWGGEDYDRLYQNYMLSVWKVTWNDEELYEVQAHWQTACGRSQAVCQCACTS